jgi:predicted RNase H-like nuclease
MEGFAIDIPIGLIDGTQPCDGAARKLPGFLRCCSVFQLTGISLSGLRGVGVDDVLDAAVAAWSAMRLWEGSAEVVCAAGQDNRGLRAAIHF